MTISDKDRRLLHDRSGGECAYSACSERSGLEEAHIEARSRGGARFNPKMTDDERDGYANFIVLCPNHHTEVDADNGEAWPTRAMKKMKEAHERDIASRSNRMTQLAGEVRARGRDVREVTGVRITEPTLFQPGTRITADGERVDRVTGVEIAGSDDA